jgi:hypothetical protein
VAEAGVLATATLGRGTEASDIGGEGGSWMSETAGLERDLASSGVVTSGELAVEFGDCSTSLSKVGDSNNDRSVEMAERCRDSCFFILSCISSASILRSDSSSFKRCDSILSCSRSCSPPLISSSRRTARSIAMLYLDSISSRDELVLRA